MQKETVVATVRATLALSETYHSILASRVARARSDERDSSEWAAESDRPTKRERDERQELEEKHDDLPERTEAAWRYVDDILAESGVRWNAIFIETVEQVIRQHFRQIGLPENEAPSIRLTDTSRGSWMMEAAITFGGTVGGLYGTLKAFSELDTIADGLEKTKKRITDELKKKFDKAVPERIEQHLPGCGSLLPLPGPQSNGPVFISCTIDARPLRALTPDKIKSHSIHLAVGVSRSSLTVENLGDKDIESLRIGLFASRAQKHSWSYAEAYERSVTRLSGRQTISLSLESFKDQRSRSELEIPNTGVVYVDCWLQDNSGIYLFNFLLEP